MSLQSVKDKVAAFENDMKGVLEKCRLPTISTMTVSVELDDSISISHVKERFDEAFVQDFLLKVFHVQGAVILKKDGVNFNNSIVFKLPSRGENTKGKKLQQAIKVFCNGNLHITGFKTLSDVIDIAEIFATMFELIDGGDGVSDVYTIKDFNVQLINAYYSTQVPEGKMIALDILYPLMQEYSSYYTSYNNDHYAGVIIKSPDFTVMVFQSGNVILSSLTSATQLQQAFEFMQGFFDKHSDTCCISSLSVCVSSTSTQRGEKRLRGKAEGFDYGKFIVLK